MSAILVGKLTDRALFFHTGEIENEKKAGCNYLGCRIEPLDPRAFHGYEEQFLKCLRVSHAPKALCEQSRWQNAPRPGISRRAMRTRFKTRKRRAERGML
jgi:hypothetical protein